MEEHLCTRCNQPVDLRLQYHEWFACVHALQLRNAALEAESAELRSQRDLDTDRLEWLADEVKELWFGGRKFDVAQGADELRRAIDEAARKHLSILKTKLEALDAAREQKP